MIGHVLAGGGAVPAPLPEWWFLDCGPGGLEPLNRDPGEWRELDEAREDACYALANLLAAAVMKCRGATCLTPGEVPVALENALNSSAARTLIRQHEGLYAHEATYPNSCTDLADGSRSFVGIGEVSQ